MSMTVAYLLMAVAILFTAISSCILHKFNNKGIETTGDLFFFNSGISFIWTVIMTCWFFASGEVAISPAALVFGTIYGVLLCAFLYFKTTALTTGPVSLTTLISCCAFVIATGFGVVYANEKVNVFQIIGMLMLLVSLVLCVNPKKSGEKLTVKWFVYAFLFFLAGGFVGIFYKVFGKSSAAAEVNGMMLTAAVVSMVMFGLFGVVINKGTGKPMPKIRKSALIYILLAGATSCIYIRLNVSLSAVIPSAVFFPVSNGSTVILSTIAGKFLFGEKLKPIQTIGIIIGFAAIVITGCGQAIFELIV